VKRTSRKRLGQHKEEEGKTKDKERDGQERIWKGQGLQEEWEAKMVDESQG
jgi:hypothetical protein